MMNRCTIVIVLACAAGCFALTGEEILAKMDVNRDHATISAGAVMRIYIGDEVREKTMRIRGITKGNKSIVEFTNPEDEGTRFLMLDDELWIYFPDEQDVVKISGHMLKEGMMGSDVSYEDALETDKLSQKYAITLEGEEACNGSTCHVIVLEAKVKDAPYYKRRMWVDTQTFVAWKEEMYAKSGKLLKVANVLEVKKVGKRSVPVKSEMVNKLRSNSKTVFEMHDIEFDTPMKEEDFSLRWLRR
jgi:outer membrane lipoprotein-sorting protein